MSRLDVIPVSVICQPFSASWFFMGVIDPSENDLITVCRQFSPSRCSSQPQGSSGSSVYELRALERQGEGLAVRIEVKRRLSAS
jgi:hypothetical protein